MTPESDIDLGLDPAFIEPVEHASTGTGSVHPVPVSFITGIAGTGKTHSLRARIAADPSLAALASTTGISAVNLGTITLNGLLHYFDTASLEDSYISGRLTRTLHSLATGKDRVRNLAIDEVSMMDGEQLDIIHRAIGEVNEQADMKEPFGLILTGDFCQLPPVKAKWAFEAECWPEFAASTITLTHPWRQSNPAFLAGLNAIRRGDGPEGAALLRETPVTFASAADPDFDGTTILGRNAEVDRYNWLRYSKLPGQEIVLASSRWGKERGEWANIPPILKLKKGALVMVLANDTFGNYSYANGDLGNFDGMVEISNPCPDASVFQSQDWDKIPAARIILKRTGKAALIPQVSRANLVKGDKDEKPSEALGAAGAHYDPNLRKWVTGKVTFWPLRLAYASTVHKTQGLSLDNVQIDPRDRFYGESAMVYVAISRCRTPEGLRVVGGHELLGKRVKVDPKVRPWL